MYTPDKVVVSIAGNVDEKLINEVESYFGSYQGGEERLELVKPSFHENRITRKKIRNKPTYALVTTDWKSAMIKHTA